MPPLVIALCVTLVLLVHSISILVVINAVCAVKVLFRTSLVNLLVNYVTSVAFNCHWASHRVTSAHLVLLQRPLAHQSVLPVHWVSSVISMVPSLVHPVLTPPIKTKLAKASVRIVLLVHSTLTLVYQHVPSVLLASIKITQQPLLVFLVLLALTSRLKVHLFVLHVLLAPSKPIPAKISVKSALVVSLETLLAPLFAMTALKAPFNL